MTCGFLKKSLYAQNFLFRRKTNHCYDTGAKELTASSKIKDERTLEQIGHGRNGDVL